MNEYTFDDSNHEGWDVGFDCISSCSVPFFYVVSNHLIYSFQSFRFVEYVTHCYIISLVQTRQGKLMLRSLAKGDNSVCLLCQKLTSLSCNGIIHVFHSQNTYAALSHQRFFKMCFFILNKNLLY